jgi:hypothetical protein
MVDDKQKIMTQLAEDASYFRPELFSVYGVSTDGRPFLGWGMKLGEDEAVFYEPRTNSTWLSSSADQVLRTHQRIGEASLVWLDD